jgi:protoheme ferro-lyase
VTVQLSATAPIAKLRLAYAYARQAEAGDPAAASKARAAYEDFFSLWNSADADISVLKQAKVNHAKLCSDAKRGVGKDLAKQYAEKALAILNAHKVPPSSWTDTGQYRGEVRRSAEKILKQLTPNHG